MAPTAIEARCVIEADDPIGRETLQRMASVDRYNRWIFREIAPFVGQTVLEVGCGIGNMTRYLLQAPRVIALDRLPGSVALVAETFAGVPDVQVCLGDITTSHTVELLADYPIDTVVCLNVLEHIAHDDVALQHMFQLLRPGGYLLLFVPAGAYMYGTLDRALGHFRRYERTTLVAQVKAAGFQPQRVSYLNLAGIPGWWLNSRVLHRQLLPKGQLRLFNALAPLLITGERALRRLWDVPAGQSLLCIARKPCSDIVFPDLSVKPGRAGIGGLQTLNDSE